MFTVYVNEYANFTPKFATHSQFRTIFHKIFRKVSQTILLSNQWRLQVKKKAIDDVIRNIKIKSLWRPAFVCELVSEFAETQFHLV